MTTAAEPETASTSSSATVTVASLDALVDQLCAEVGELQPQVRLRALRRWHAKLAAAEAQVVADKLASGASARAVESELGSGRQRSRSQAKKLRQRGDALRQRPELAEAVASGRLGLDSLDQLTKANEASDGAALDDDDLVDHVGRIDADQTGRVLKDWNAARTNAEALEDRRQKQLALRSAWRWTDSDGVAAITAKGDSETIAMLWRRIRSRANTMYVADGGRKIPTGRHARSNDQRLFDAFVEECDRSVPGGPVGDASGEGPGPRRSRGCGSTCRNRPLLILTQTIGDDGERSIGEMAGHGPLPSSIFERLACTADLAGVVFGQSGQPLWVSRDKREITPAQWRALVSRDRSCVITGAEPDLCEAHHVIPWNSRLAGRSTVDNYVLVSRSFHRWLHDNHRTMFREPDGAWNHRPATPDEIPIDSRPNHYAP